MNDINSIWLHKKFYAVVQKEPIEQYYIKGYEPMANDKYNREKPKHAMKIIHKYTFNHIRTDKGIFIADEGNTLYFVSLLDAFVNGRLNTKENYRIIVERDGKRQGFAATVGSFDSEPTLTISEIIDSTKQLRAKLCTHLCKWEALSIANRIRRILSKCEVNMNDEECNWRTPIRNGEEKDEMD